MAIPQFPPQDLAKLVLGYLAEEELMTAYDEFLQASPYLDAFSNEYDRIFMTSLRTILADYRAVKIYVETCKPHLLRKRLLHCTNLLEIIKCLINLIDPHKLYIQDNIDKNSFQKANVQREVACENCNSLNLKSCICKSKTSITGNAQSTSDDHSVPIAVEATSLEDLPGNSSSKSKLKSDLKNSISADQKDAAAQKLNTIINTSVVQSSFVLPSSENVFPQISKAGCVDSKQKIEEFNNILNLVCNKNVTNDKLCDNLVSNNISNRVSNEENDQHFLHGAHGSSHEKVTRVPDSSTTDMFIPQAHKPAKETLISNIKGPPKQLIYSPIINIDSPLISNNQAAADKSQIINNNLVVNKVGDNKIKILSDVKFDKNFPCSTMPPILKGNPTSSPSLPMRTLLINGTPAYKQKTPKVNSYSKDEIMAMPTLIIVPTSGPYNIVSRTATTTANNQKNKNEALPKNETSTISPKRAPLFIEVPLDNMPSQSNQISISAKANDVGLVKTVDSVVHASLPKDNTVLSKTSTPQVLPPARKSSSTPRRSSHVRVLDFTTPRRILNEAIAESDESVVVVSDSPVHNDIMPASNNEAVTITNITRNLNSEINKEQKTVKKRCWDEELRALVAASENQFPSNVPKSTKKKKITKNKSTQNTDPNNYDSKESTKVKKVKKKTKSADYVEEPEPSDIKSDKLVKPTINIISASEHVTMKSVQEKEKEILSNDIENQIDTPENERLCLQNVIGAKLNISDLLETPYKQAIYDIQMETPRFLGPDLPDEPVSDIKIMNIPTPRFFDTPKPPQATPSSYSSRPTDYSSGGSYYKPDDQDYVPSTELTECKITEPKNKNKDLKSSDSSSKEISKDTEAKSVKTRRPVRKCTKNVSYYNSPNVHTLTKPQNVSSEEDTKPSNSDVSGEKTIKTVRSKTGKSKISKTKGKTERHKSPFRKENPKNFMKIKPRRLTPVKDAYSKNRRSVSDTCISAKKKNVKEKNHNTSPSVVVAPTKSRRKSSTPRKLHCNKSFHSSTSSNTSPDIPKDCNTERKDVNLCVTHDSDSEQQPLRWSDDGSQDAKHKESNETSGKEGEDIITKIQEYIETIESDKKSSNESSNLPLGSLQKDLIKRGFDLETAKIIERDLLDTPPIQDGAVQSTSSDAVSMNIKEKKVVITSDCIESKGNDIINQPAISKEQDEQDDSDENDDVEFGVKETNEETNNFFVHQFDETKFKPNVDIVKLKDKFSMEVCIDDGLSVRLRATQFSVVLDQEPAKDKEYDRIELESAVSSIANMDKLYTPIKDPRIQCYEIFDSTLTSLDTPLKISSPKQKEHESSVTEIVLEIENISSKAEGKKRKRVQSGASDEGSNVNKKTKADTQYLLNPANIQNIDIESVLSKLHGP